MLEELLTILLSSAASIIRAAIFTFSFCLPLRSITS
jgi:hypothetical protein